MKIAVTQPVLIESLKKGGLAALSTYAQADNLAANLLRHCVRIDITDKFTVSSVNNVIASQFQVALGKEHGVICEDQGSLVIPAKELLDWANAQGKDSTLNITIEPLEHAQMISLAGDDDGQDELAIRKVADVNLVARDKKKRGSKWALDGYDKDSVEVQTFLDNTEKTFTLSIDALKDIFTNTTFCALNPHSEHILDNLALQVYKDGVYAMATDMKRCAIYSLPNINKDKIPEKFLVSINVLETALKELEADINVELLCSPENGQLFMRQPKFDIRLTCPDEKTVGAYPPIEILLGYQCSDLAMIDANSFTRALKNASLVNKFTALFHFNKDEKSLTVRARSENGIYKPSVSAMELEEVHTDGRAVWALSHLKEAVRHLGSQSIQLLAPEDFSILVVRDSENEFLTYYAITIRSSKQYEQKDE